MSKENEGGPILLAWDSHWVEADATISINTNVGDIKSVIDTYSRCTCAVT